MNKAQLVNMVAEDVGLSKRDTKVVVESVINRIIDGIHDDGKVTLVGLGCFTKKERNPRVARNPKTGERIDVPAKTVVKFKTSQQLLSSLNL
jgi:nucleoid DNA-binding protein